MGFNRTAIIGGYSVAGEKDPWLGDHIERLVRVETQIRQQQSSISDISRDLREVRDAIRSASGGWKLIVAGASVAAAFAAVGNFLWRH